MTDVQIPLYVVQTACFEIGKDVCTEACIAPPVGEIERLGWEIAEGASDVVVVRLYLAFDVGCNAWVVDVYMACNALSGVGGIQRDILIVIIVVFQLWDGSLCFEHELLETGNLPFYLYVRSERSYLLVVQQLA